MSRKPMHLNSDCHTKEDIARWLAQTPHDDHADEWDKYISALERMQELTVQQPVPDAVRYYATLVFARWGKKEWKADAKESERLMYQLRNAFWGNQKNA